MWRWAVQSLFAQIVYNISCKIESTIWELNVGEEHEEEEKVMAVGTGPVLRQSATLRRRRPRVRDHGLRAWTALDSSLCFFHNVFGVAQQDVTEVSQRFQSRQDASEMITHA